MNTVTISIIWKWNMIENAIRKFPAVGWMRNSLTDTGFHEVHSFKISSMEEARDTANVVAQRKVVLINYEGIDRELGQRAVDFIFGNCYASNASCIKISNYIFLGIPESITLVDPAYDLLSEAIAGCCG